MARTKAQKSALSRQTHENKKTKIQEVMSVVAAKLEKQELGMNSCKNQIKNLDSQTKAKAIKISGLQDLIRLKKEATVKLKARITELEQEKDDLDA